MGYIMLDSMEQRWHAECLAENANPHHRESESLSHFVQLDTDHK